MLKLVRYQFRKKVVQGTGSVSDPDPHSMAAWIRIPNVDPDQGDLKNAGKTDNFTQKVF
jgi:hypothetical protein